MQKIVKYISLEEVEKKWGCKLPFKYRKENLYIDCDSKGNINFDTANVYTLTEGLNNSSKIFL
jgi:hypothetical protein